MGPEEIPDEFGEARQSGDTTARSFKGFLDLVDQEQEAFRVPGEASVEHLVRVVETIVSGEVVSVDLNRSSERLGSSEAERVELQISVRVREQVKGSVPEETLSWTAEVWFGDPVLGPTVEERLLAELGPGPLGSEVLLFGRLRDEDQTMTVLDGMISDGDEAFVLRPDTLGSPLDPSRPISEIVTEIRESVE